MINANPGAIGAAANTFGALADTLGTSRDRLSSAVSSAAGSWQGGGASAAFQFADVFGTFADQAREQLVLVGAAMRSYQTEIEAAQLDWDRADTEEQQLKQELQSLQTQLQQDEAANLQAQVHAAQQAQAHLLTPSNPFTTPIAPPVHLIDTTGLQARITQIQHEIQQLDQRKKHDEDEAKQSSQRFTAAMNEAAQIWPAAGLGPWPGAEAGGCQVGYIAPVPKPSGGGGPGLFSWIAAGGLVLGTAAANLIPGAGEAQDAAAPGELAGILGADGADAAASTATAAETATDASLGSRILSQTLSSLPGAAANAGGGFVEQVIQDLILHGKVDWTGDASNGLAFAAAYSIFPIGGPVAKAFVGGFDGQATQNLVDGRPINPVQDTLAGVENAAGQGLVGTYAKTYAAPAIKDLMNSSRATGGVIRALGGSRGAAAVGGLQSGASDLGGIVPSAVRAMREDPYKGLKASVGR